MSRVDPETREVRRFRGELSRRGFDSRKLHGSSRQSGLPDVVFWGCGITGFVEMKVAGSRVGASRAQRHTIDSMTARGVSAAVCYGHDRALDWVRLLIVRKYGEDSRQTRSWDDVDESCGTSWRTR